ncbi:hypothetical protein NA57DRAFT_74468 [Rhizodiscina lignyota]|uniref:Uncharacterized protein n=1 Tax=Rhizodiscina lignyota TaxID=1504668 RepID=A0A9P4MCP4_9PEZI|nr:hypothetical protein NA57DRAFT_74468 [Rhizodiscina lignyota]
MSANTGPERAGPSTGHEAIEMTTFSPNTDLERAGPSTANETIEMDVMPTTETLYDRNTPSVPVPTDAPDLPVYIQNMQPVANNRDIVAVYMSSGTLNWCHTHHTLDRRLTERFCSFRDIAGSFALMVCMIFLAIFGPFVAHASKEWKSQLLKAALLPLGMNLLACYIASYFIHVRAKRENFYTCSWVMNLLFGIPFVIAWVVFVDILFSITNTRCVVGLPCDPRYPGIEALIATGNFIDADFFMQVSIPGRLGLHRYDIAWSSATSFSAMYIGISLCITAGCFGLARLERVVMKHDTTTVRGWMRRYWALLTVYSLCFSLQYLLWGVELNAPATYHKEWIWPATIAYVIALSIAGVHLIIHTENGPPIARREAVSIARQVLGEMQTAGCGVECPNVRKAVAILIADGR